MLEIWNPRKSLEPNRHLLFSSYQYFFIHPRSLLSHPKEHHCLQNDSNVKWTQYAAHTLPCVSVLNVLMHILIHKYCIGCSVVWRRSCFQLSPLSRLRLFSSLVHRSRKKCYWWYGMIWAYCMLALTLSLYHVGKGFWPTNRVVTRAPPIDLCLFKILHLSLVT